MRNLHLLDDYRDCSRAVLDFYGSTGDHETGVFVIPSPIDKAPLRVIATVGDGWDHVSVSRSNRCPNWPEMDFIKRLFFRNREVAMQLHVAVSDHISVHPYCLHLWRPLDGGIPLPPKSMVA